MSYLEMKLDKATCYIMKMYFRCTGQWPCMKTKYGTLRFEMFYTWLYADDDLAEERVLIFLKILNKACRKFPEISGEILDEILFDLDPEDMVSFELGKLKNIYDNSDFVKEGYCDA